MTWDEAVSRYGEYNLPTVSQCSAMAENCDKIKAAMKAFGGRDMDWSYWGKEDDSSLAWLVGMTYGYVHYTNKTYAYRVRAVAPVPVASAM